MCFIVMAILFSGTMTASADDEYDIRQTKYYQVIYNRVLHRSPMGAEWSDWITQSILYYSANYQIDPLLVTALFEQESGFNMASRSCTGAVGIAQLQPETAAGLGFNPVDPAQNIEGGVRYLSGQLSRFRSSGQWAATYAIAAYNAGPGAIQKYGGVPPFAETQNHVNRVAKIYQQLQAAMGQ